MTYRLYYGNPVAVLRYDAHVDDRVRSERFSTEPEALQRARELLEEDCATAVAIHDAAGNRLSGIRLQLKLGYCCD
jgi:hypothetical protein